MSVAKRVMDLDVSGIRKVFELGAQLKNPINLSIGQPDFDVPEAIKTIAIDRIQKGFNRYTLTGGIPELRHQLIQYLKNKGVESESSIVTSGVSGGIFLSILALVNPGEEILTPDPYFVMYKQLPPLVGAVVKTIDTYPDFMLDPEKLKRAITPKTKLLFLNSPANPTGVIMNEEKLKAIAEVLKDTGIWVVSDEIYEAFDYEGKHQFFGKYYDRTITLGGFSKNVGITGWRVGYAASKKEIIDAMIKLQQYTFVCAPSFAQYACLKALDFDFSSFKKNYSQKRDCVWNGLKNKYEFVKPDGAFYFFMKHPRLNGEEVVKKALEKEVLLVPGSVFSSKNSHFRLSFAAKDETLKKGIERLLEID